MKKQQQYFWFYLTVIAYSLTALLVFQNLLAGHAWWWSPMSAVPPWGWLFIPLFALVVFCFRRKNIILLACGIIGLLLAMGQSDINFGAFWNRPPTAQENAITIFSWNSLAWKQGDRQKWLDYVASHQADVVFLQEIIQPRTWDTPYPTELTARFPGYRLIPHGEWLTITKLPVVGVYGARDQYWLRVDVDMNGKRVSLYNVHIPVHMDPALALRDPGKFFEDMHERNALRDRQFALLEKELRSNDYPKIIAGDFNSTRSMGALGYYYGNFTDVSSLGTDLFPATWGDFGINFWRIDWAFVSKDLKAVAYQIAPRSGISDHAAQIFQVTY